MALEFNNHNYLLSDFINTYINEINKNPNEFQFMYIVEDEFINPEYRDELNRIENRLINYTMLMDTLNKIDIDITKSDFIIQSVKTIKRLSYDGIISVTIIRFMLSDITTTCDTLQDAIDEIKESSINNLREYTIRVKTFVQTYPVEIHHITVNPSEKEIIISTVDSVNAKRVKYMKQGVVEE